MEILDLGCGYGWHCIYFCQKKAARVIGVDLSEKMLETARKKSAGLDISYLRCAMEDVDFPKASFDMVFSSLALHSSSMTEARAVEEPPVYALRMLRCCSENTTSPVTASVMETFEAIYRNFPYDMAIEKERGYQIAFHAVLSSLSLERVEAEDKTSLGRADIAITVRSGLVYIIELKLDRSAEEALKQIKEKKYYEKYAKDGAVIHLLGINFSSAERNITEWKEEVLTL